MMTAQDRLKFAVEFARMDLGELRPGDWLNLKDGLTEFLGLGKGGMNLQAMAGYVCLPLSAPNEMSEKDFDSLQARVRSLFNGIVLEKIPPVAGQHEGGHKGIVTPIDPNWKYLPITLSGLGNVLVIQGACQGVFMGSLMHLVGKESTDKIRKCSRPDCSNIFYRVRKQKFCSQRCYIRHYMRTYMRTYPQTEQAKTARPGTNRRHYKKRRARKSGVKSVVKRAAKQE
jgi:hypothetical protein